MKKCPFCGTEEKENYDLGKTQIVLEARASDSNIGYWYVYCLNCKARGPMRDGRDKAEISWGVRH